MMLQDPSRKYRSFPVLPLTDRVWPTRVIETAPIWLSTDLRDGNQALREPLGIALKREFFARLCAIGFREIEVGFPSASRTEFDFVRGLIDESLVSADVTIGALTPARPELITRTILALKGARRAIVHIYNAISPVFRDVVFKKDKAAVVAMAVDAVRHARLLTRNFPETEWVLQYSPEDFSAAEIAFSKGICDAVVAAWESDPGERVIINLPATVEMSTPNVFADQVEWMHRHLAQRDAIILSVHPHNDRGTAIAAAELALMAGAQRVEGCVLGNGERTGNVDLLVLAMNLYTQGVAPGLDFSDIDDLAATVARLTGLPVSPRHPYVGELVYTAFAGSHQDAIKKGLAAQAPRTLWRVPYLPLDPADVGRDYEAVIRVNSQSGKGGLAYILETHYGIVLPRPMLMELSAAVQTLADETGREITPEQIWQVFSNHYLDDRGLARYVGHDWSGEPQTNPMHLTLIVAGITTRYEGHGNGPLDAAAHALPIPVRVCHYEERSCASGSSAEALAVVAVEPWAGGPVVFAAGIHTNIVTAGLLALVRAWSRLQAKTAGTAGPATGEGASWAMG